MGAVAAGRVCLVPGDCTGPGAADGPAHRTFPDTGMNCGLSVACPAVMSGMNAVLCRSARLRGKLVSVLRREGADVVRAGRP